MTEIVILDRIFNGYRIEYTNKIYEYKTITKYIQDELLKMLKNNNLYNLMPSVYNLKFKIFKTRDSDRIIYAESINKYIDYEELYFDSLKDIDVKNELIEELIKKVARLNDNNIESLINENKDLKNTLYLYHTRSNVAKKEIDKLKNEKKYLNERIKDLEMDIINEKYKYNYIF